MPNASSTYKCKQSKKEIKGIGRQFTEIWLSEVVTKKSRVHTPTEMTINNIFPLFLTWAIANIHQKRVKVFDIYYGYLQVSTI